MSELKAVAALTQILGIVQSYLPPDSGMTDGDALSQIIAVVDQWPLDGEPQLPAIPAGWEGSWRWMRHPTWNHGEPIPVQVWKEASTGVVYYRPFDCRAQDFEWELRNSDWEEIAPAPQPSAVDGATLAGLIASEGHLSQLVDQMRALLVEVEDVCGHDDRGFEFEDGESEIIDKVRAMIAVTSEPQQTAPERHPVGKEQVPVAVIGNDWTLLFTDGGPIDQIAKKHGLKIGSLLYTQPPAVEPVPVAWRGSPAPGYLGRHQYTDIGLQAEAWEKQGLQVEPLYAAPQPPALEPQPHHWIESLPAMAREVFSNCYPAEIQKEIDDVIGWLASVIYVETCAKSQTCTESQSVTPAAAQPTPPNPGELKPDYLANIDSPFNACMHQEHCKRWRDAAARKQLTLEELADKWLSVRHIVHATDRQIAFARAIEADHGITAPKPLCLPSDDTEGGAV